MKTGDISVRVIRTEEERDLDGYIFSDFVHAKTWLTQRFVDAAYKKTIQLQYVTCIGKKCLDCGTPKLKEGQTITVDEFLRLHG